jgi:hypothetical protein
MTYRPKRNLITTDWSRCLTGKTLSVASRLTAELSHHLNVQLHLHGTLSSYYEVIYLCFSRDISKVLLTLSIDIN